MFFQSNNPTDSKKKLKKTSKDHNTSKKMKKEKRPY
jgi:hypothetical protein